VLRREQRLDLSGARRAHENDLLKIERIERFYQVVSRPLH
jgi:hypothetical protein